MKRDKYEVIVIPGRDWTGPEDTGPCVILHQRLDERLSKRNPCHAFGPFLDLASALAFMEGPPDEDDDCIKAVVALIPPPGTMVIDQTAMVGAANGDHLN